MRILYELTRCECKEEFLLKDKTKKKRKVKRRKPRVLKYPLEENRCKIFQMKSEKQLSSIAKLLLNSFQKKYLYYAIDDILDSLKSNPNERDNLLAILYSPVLSLQNNLSINFFDIWIDSIYINEVSKMNKFLTQSSSRKQFSYSYITIKLLYRPARPVKKQKSLW